MKCCDSVYLAFTQCSTDSRGRAVERSSLVGFRDFSRFGFALRIASCSMWPLLQARRPNARVAGIGLETLIRDHMDKVVAILK